jgi:hypothetical protein
MIQEPVFPKIRTEIDGAQIAWHELQAARGLIKTDRPGWATLNSLFRQGTVPDPVLNGQYEGELLAIDVAPGFTQLFQGLAKLWMPWLGKTFHSPYKVGDNIFSKDSYAVARFFNPGYRGFMNDSPTTYRAFAFHTYTGPGVADPDRIVLKIDYNLRGNPPLTVRRVLDELVQLADNVYLGKAHVRWWWRRAGSWQTVAYFTLTK